MYVTNLPVGGELVPTNPLSQWLFNIFQGCGHLNIFQHKIRPLNNELCSGFKPTDNRLTSLLVSFHGPPGCRTSGVLEDSAPQTEKYWSCLCRSCYFNRKLMTVTKCLFFFFPGMFHVSKRFHNGWEKIKSANTLKSFKWNKFYWKAITQCWADINF